MALDQPTTEQPSTPNVLIVDDSADTRSVIARMVIPVGVNVIEAANGRQALSIIKKQKIDVVLSDLVMPRMSGLMLLHSMLEQGHHMPFVLITGFSDKDSAIQALRLGAFDYLEKPLHESELQPVLEEALKVSRQQQTLLIETRRIPSPGPDTPIDGHAEIQIMKMRAYRFRGDTREPGAGPAHVESWQDLKNLFVQEAEQQLTFNESAIRALLQSQSLATDLAFVLRVVQSMRIACESIKLAGMAEVAWALETLVAALRQMPAKLTPEKIELMLSANQVLTTMVQVLGSTETRDCLARLEAATADVVQAKASA